MPSGHSEHNACSPCATSPHPAVPHPARFGAARWRPAVCKRNKTSAANTGCISATCHGMNSLGCSMMPDLQGAVSQPHSCLGLQQKGRPLLQLCIFLAQRALQHKRRTNMGRWRKETSAPTGRCGWRQCARIKPLRYLSGPCSRTCISITPSCCLQRAAGRLSKPMAGAPHVPRRGPTNPFTYFQSVSG